MSEPHDHDEPTRNAVDDRAKDNDANDNEPDDFEIRLTAIARRLDHLIDTAIGTSRALNELLETRHHHNNSPSLASRRSDQMANPQSATPSSPYTPPTQPSASQSSN